MTTEQYPLQTPPPKRPLYKRAWFIVLATLIVMGLLFGACLAAVGGALNEAAKTTDATVKRAGTPTTAVTPAATEASKESTYDKPAVGDFKLQVKELSRQRFGSAGDNVDYRVQLVQVRDRTYDPDKSYELTYRLFGSEYGTETQTMTVQGDEYESYEGSTSTRSGVKITAKPLSIEET